MDFKSMKRKELQRLCKHHEIPANLSNLEMAKKLQEIFKQKENSQVQGLVKGKDEGGTEPDSTDVVVNRQVKKVRFSPENELIEFTKSRDLKRRSRRNSILSTNGGVCVENDDIGEMNNKNVGIGGRVTRSRGFGLMEGQMDKKKGGKKSSESYDQKVKVSATENFDNGQLRESDAPISARVTRLRAKISVEVVENQSKRGRKRAKDEDEGDQKALSNVDDEKLIQEVVDNPGRVTRSRGQKLMEASTRTENREVVKNMRIENRGSGQGVKSNGKGLNEVLESDKTAGLHVIDEPQVSLRRSRWNQNRVGDSAIPNDDTRQHENGGTKGSKKTVKLARNGPGVDAAIIGGKVDQDGRVAVQVEEEPIKQEPRRSNRRKNPNRVGDSAIPNDNTRQHENAGIKGSRKTMKFAGNVSGKDAEIIGGKVDPDGRVVVQVEEPIKQEPRRSNRRKNAIASNENQGNGGLKAENLSRYSLRRGSVPEVVNSDGLSKDDKNVPQPTGVLRRSRRKTPSLKLVVPGNENIENDAAVTDLESKEHLRKQSQVEKRGSAVNKNKKKLVLDEFSGDSVQKKNEARKRKRGPISEGDVAKISPSSVTRSTKEHRSAKTAAKALIRESLLLEAHVSDMSEGAESTNNNPQRENIDVSIADTAGRADMNLTNGNELENSEENAASRNAGLNTDSGKQISAVKITDAETVHLLPELDVKELIQQDITNADKNDLEAQVFGRAENYSSNALIDNNLLPEGSGVSGNEGFAETNGDQREFKTSLEVTNAEANKPSLPSADVVEHFGEVKGITVQENLELAEIFHLVLESDVQELIEKDSTNMDKNDPEPQVIRQSEDSTSNALTENQVLPKGSNVSGKEGFHENSYYIESLLLGDQTISKTGVEVAQAEAEKCTQPSSAVIDHCVEVQEISIQENLVIAETEQANVIISPISCHHDDVDHLEASKLISGNTNKHTSPKSGEIGAFESCERCIDSTDSKSALQIKEPSSSKLRKCEDGNTAEGDETYIYDGIESKIVETDEGECLKDHKNESNEYNEFIAPDLFDAERSPGVISQDRRKHSGDCSAMASHEQGVNNDSLAVSPITICTNSSGIDPSREHEADCTSEIDEILPDKNMHSEVDETDQGGPSKDHEIQCGEDGKFDEQEMFHDSHLLAPATISSCAEISIQRDEDHKIAEAHESYACKDIQSRLAETDEGGWLENHKSAKDESLELCVSNLSDGEKSTKISPEDKGMISLTYFIKDINEQVILHDFPVVSTIHASCNEVQFTAGSSSSLGIGPSKPNSPSEKDSVPTFSNTYGVDQEAGAAEIQEKELDHSPRSIPGHEMSMDKTNSYGEHEIFDQADELTCTHTYERAEKPKSPLVKPTAMVSTVQEEASSSASESAGHAMCILMTNSKTETTLLVECPDTDVDDNDTNRCKDKQDFADLLIADKELSMDYTISKAGVESLSKSKFQDSNVNCDACMAEVEICMGNAISGLESLSTLKFEETDQSKNLLTGQRESYPGEEPTNMVSSQSWIELELNNLFGATVDNVSPTELNDTSSQGTEIASSGGSFTQKKQKTEGERRSESDWEDNFLENQLNLLFATPIKTVAPCKVDETSAHDRKLDSAAMLTPECVGTMKENAITETRPDEKVLDAGCEPEEETNEELNEVESLELPNISTAVLSGAEYDGCGALEEQLNDDTCECSKVTNLITEENKEEKIIQSCLYDEAIDNESESIEKNIVSSSGSMKNLDKLESSQDMLVGANLPVNISSGRRVYLKAEEEMMQVSEAPSELSDADFQKSDFSDDCHHRAGSVSDQKDVLDKGTSPSLCTMACDDNDDVTERKDVNSSRGDDVPCGAKVCIETVKSPTSSHDRTDELHNNSGVGFKAIGTTIQNVDNIVLAAENESCVYGDESDTLSSPSLHVLFGQNINAEDEKSEETPDFGREGDRERNSEEVKENSTARTVQVSTPKLQVEENLVDCSNDNKVSDMPRSVYNEILKESDVADTIKEYIDSESSLSLDLDDSCGPNLPLSQIDERTMSGNSALSESEDCIDERPSKPEDEDDKPSSVENLETEGKELEIAKLFTETATESGEAVKCPELLDEGSTGSRPLVESQDGQSTPTKQLSLMDKKNARTILIHGTPAKFHTVVDMKENAQKHKSSNVVGDFTTVRPSKRRALQDVQWK